VEIKTAKSMRSEVFLVDTYDYEWCDRGTTLFWLRTYEVFEDKRQDRIQRNVKQLASCIHHYS
jgi:hypothetical protein